MIKICPPIKLVCLMSLFAVLFALILSCFAFASEINENDWLVIDSETPTGPLMHHDQTPIANTNWNAVSHQLDLTGATIDDYDELSIDLKDEDVIINVTNYNKIYGKGGIGIYSKGNLLLKGTGILDIEGADCQNNADTSYGIRVSSGSFTAKDLCLNLTSAKSDKSSYGLYASGTKKAVTFDNANVNVLVKGDKKINQGIVADSNINVNNNSSINVVVEDALSGHSQQNNIAIYQVNKKDKDDDGVYINNSDVIVKSGNGTDGDGSNSYGIYANAGLVCNNSSIDADSGFVSTDKLKTSCGIYAKNKCFIKNSSKIDTFACDGYNSYGLQADCDIDVDNSTLNAKSCTAKQYSNGVYCSGNSFYASNGSQVKAISGDIEGSALSKTSTAALYATASVEISGYTTYVNAIAGNNYVTGSQDYDTSIGISSHGYSDECFKVADGATVYATGGDSSLTSYGVYSRCPAFVGNVDGNMSTLVATAGNSDESYGIYSNGIDINNATFYSLAKTGQSYAAGLWSDGGSVNFGDNVNCQFGSFEGAASCQHCAVAARDAEANESEITFNGGQNSYFIDNCNEDKIYDLMTFLSDDKVVTVQKPYIGLTSLILDSKLHAEPGTTAFEIPVSLLNFVVDPTSMDVIIYNENNEANYYKVFDDVAYLDDKLVVDISDAPVGDYNLQVSTNQFGYDYTSHSSLNVSSSFNPSEAAQTSDSTPFLLIALIFCMLIISSIYIYKRN